MNGRTKRIQAEQGGDRQNIGYEWQNKKDTDRTWGRQAEHGGDRQNIGEEYRAWVWQKPEKVHR